MNCPKLYTTVNSLQKRDAAEALDLVKDSLTWNCDEAVLDVGCGPGDLTTSLLTSYLASPAKVVGCDISEAMVKFAQATYGDDRYSFKQMDISNGNIWMNWEGESFDKIFSFYCLHWVKDQVQAAENMYNLLKPSGYIVTFFTISHPFLVLFNVLQRNPKWSPYAKVWKTWEVFTAKGKDPKTEYVQILKKTGFEVLNCSTVQRSFTHASKKAFIDYFQSINPFKNRIPEDKSDEFLEDCTQYLQDLGLLEVNEMEEYIHKYTVMTTAAQKVPILETCEGSSTSPSSIYEMNF